MNKQQMKLENPDRLGELNPEETLKRIGLRENDVLCDVGAGSGIFSIPAAKITRGIVYALEVSEEMLAVMGEKARGIDNIELIKVTGDRFNLADHSADIVLLVTVLHEIQNKIVFLDEIKRILKDGGRVAVIEFHKRETPMGPAVDHRMGKDEVKSSFAGIGLQALMEFDLGDNFYCCIGANRSN